MFSVCISIFINYSINLYFNIWNILFLFINMCSRYNLVVFLLVLDFFIYNSTHTILFIHIFAFSFFIFGNKLQVLIFLLFYLFENVFLLGDEFGISHKFIFFLYFFGIRSIIYSFSCNIASSTLEPLFTKQFNLSSWICLLNLLDPMFDLATISLLFLYFLNWLWHKLLIRSVIFIRSFFLF